MKRGVVNCEAESREVVGARPKAEIVRTTKADDSVNLCGSRQLRLLPYAYTSYGCQTDPISADNVGTDVGMQYNNGQSLEPSRSKE